MTRRIGAIVVMGALAAPLIGPAPVVASAEAPAASVEAVCPPAAPGYAQCLALRRTDIAAQPASAMSPHTGHAGFGPADIQAAYALPTGSEGSGLIVAIVDAYDLPTAEADLAAYRSYYGLPPCTTANGCFRKVNQNGVAGSYPALNAGWGQEIALDIQMVSATCPNCNILLVEADSASIANLGTSVNTAVSLGAIAVSNSYGGPQWVGETAYDTSYYNHPGVAITASTGDCGYHCSGGPGSYYNSVEYPAASPYVIAVGGTRLARDGSARGWTESAWGAAGSGAGSGCSAYEPKPSWQLDTECANRTQADVSAVADPATGVAGCYNGSWYVFGGTSASSPIIASAFALAGGPAAGDYPASYLYGAATGLNDVIGGNNDVHWGSCTVTYLCNGVAGYDGPTGLGTPNGVAAFVSSVATTPATYVPLTPARLLDSRSGTGLSGALSSHVARTFQVTGGVVPAQATAVTGNLTVTQQTSAGFLYIGPIAMNDPTSSTLNFPLGDDRANAVTVALGAGGTLSVTYAAPTTGPTAYVIFDVTGYFTPDTSGATYFPLAPTRLLDSRSGTGLSGPSSSHVARTFQVTGGVVPAQATAVTGNLTVTQQTSLGFLYIGPVPMDYPTSSTLNFPVGDDRANAVTVALGAGGTLSVTYAAPTLGPTAQVIFDVTGYFTPDMSGAKYFPLTPTRLLDSRDGTGLAGASSSHVARPFQVTDRRGVPATATAVTGNLTVTQQTSLGFLYIGPIAANNPTSSTLNFPLGDDRAGAVTVALGAGGTLSATYAAPTLGPTAHVIFDVTGYFVP
ncbi:MAG: S53 family peptidase [Candidatus Limnocylindrales bacterium]